MDQRIDEDYKKLLRFKAIVSFSAITILALLILSLFFLPFEPISDFITTTVIILGVLLALLISIYFLSAIYANKWYENFSFELQNEGIQINSGVITKSRKFIPYKRIQNLEIKSGFWDRRYGLSTILIETAGHSSGYTGTWAQAEGMMPGLRDPEPILKEIRARMEKSS